MEIKDTYKTIEYETEEILFKEKNSKFFGYAFPVNNEQEAKHHIELLRKKHHSARHWCFAYQIGTEKTTFRANDDGEPSNSAGMPIYGQIQSFELTNTLVVIVRYFGGTKLGVGGLISAYKTAAQQTLESASILEKTIDTNFSISFDYKDLNKVMRIIKEKKLNIINQKMEMNCVIEISIRKKDANQIFEIFNSLFGIKIKEIEMEL